MHTAGSARFPIPGDVSIGLGALVWDTLLFHTQFMPLYRLCPVRKQRGCADSWTIGSGLESEKVRSKVRVRVPGMWCSEGLRET